MNLSLDSEIESDVKNAVTASPDQLTRLIATSARLRELYRDIASLTAKLDALDDERKDLENSVLPSMMDEAGVKSLSLDTDEQLTRDQEIFASIAKPNMSRATQWLDKNNFGSLVKSQITIAIDRENPKERERVTKLLMKSHVDFELASTIHPQTLKAFVKESVANERKLPPEFSVHIQPIVKIKSLKPVKKSTRSK